MIKQIIEWLFKQPTWLIIAFFSLFIIILVILILLIRKIKNFIRNLCRPDRYNHLPLYKELKARIVSVGDGDGIRIVLDKKYLKDSYIILKKSNIKSFPIRLYGIDAPECAHFGRPEQPFSKEAKNCLTEKCLDRNLTKKVSKSHKPYNIFKKCTITAFSIDQYGRYISQVIVNGIDLSFYMLKMAMAVVYTGRGAIYNNNLEKFLEIEAKNKNENRGIYENMKETPMEYKRRMRETS
ncbi:nuclease domain protein [Pseudoloma neurophilia]|uniref:Nuclease domain protein n=1 Tax=Pseudoloma neurophilia TaxID=146866 RepID=A0A0R0LSV1_9MICR|nr:nuclease domain protein [Pseudoloma neurophilia]